MYVEKTIDSRNLLFGIRISLENRAGGHTRCREFISNVTGRVGSVVDMTCSSTCFTVNISSGGRTFVAIDVSKEDIIPDFLGSNGVATLAMSITPCPVAPAHGSGQGKSAIGTRNVCTAIWAIE